MGLLTDGALKYDSTNFWAMSNNPEGITPGTFQIGNGNDHILKFEPEVGLTIKTTKIEITALGTKVKGGLKVEDNDDTDILFEVVAGADTTGDKILLNVPTEATSIKATSIAATGAITADSISADSITAESGVFDELSADTVSVDSLTGESVVLSDYLTTNFLRANVMNYPIWAGGHIPENTVMPLYGGVRAMAVFSWNGIDTVTMIKQLGDVVDIQADIPNCVFKFRFPNYHSTSLASCLVIGNGRMADGAILQFQKKDGFGQYTPVDSNYIIIEVREYDINGFYIYLHAFEWAYVVFLG
jgi:hypothetical protein